MIELAVRIILANDPAVSALVNQPGATDPGAARITYGVAAQSERRPRIVLTVVSKTHEHTFTGHAGYITGSIQADCLAPDYPTAKTLAAAVIDALDEYEGPVTGVTGLDISYITVDEESDIPVDVPEGAPLPSTFGVSVNFNFMIRK